LAVIYFILIGFLVVFKVFTLPADNKTMKVVIPYDNIQDEKKQKLFDQAAQLLLVKPELIGDVKTDKEYIDRIIVFSKLLYDQFPEYDDPELRESISKISKSIFN